MNVIPKLQSCKLTGETADLRKFSEVTLPEAWADLAEVADRILLSKYPKEGDNKIVVAEDKAIAKEGYRLIVAPDTIYITASDRAGALYAIETLRVLAKVDAKNPRYLIGSAEIYDAPRFSWRGVSLDEARHFFGKDAVLRLLDLLAMHKLNVLHWHLTDDQGWRLEIKKYPKLTEIGSKRGKSNIHGWSSADHDNTPHSGFYTQEEVKEIVSYAAALNITVVPEIDMPAHFAAAFAAYPELACRNIPAEVHWFFGGQYPKEIGWKDWNRSACIGKEQTFRFICGVIDEVAELFPAPYFHIGGDEAPKDEWKTCPDCQKLIKEKGLADEKQLQGYFINQVNDYVKTKGKRLIGWNEVLEGGNLDKSVLVQYWTPGKDKRVAKHLNGGGEIIMSNHCCFYFDMPYSMYPLKNTYDYKPNMAGVLKKQASQVVGVEGELWTEWVASFDKAEMQYFPRVEALAEVAWTCAKKNYNEFLARLKNFTPILEGLNVNYAEPQVACPKGGKYRADMTRQWSKTNENVEYSLNKQLKTKKSK